ncbi:unnamed protein product [Ceutorhynchus assimilis]|uniref:Ubiquitin-like protease family profile domain-containing protein n=1 Tax=Ceutorhynchus assimilis TaxID=467358 RepID=A0A9N9QKH3_9CUCU|nr:unnamed protein product [Ceutorhynchus assimilis]
MKQSLLIKKPHGLKKEYLLELNKNLATNAKNLQNVKSDVTMRKMRSEVLSSMDRHKNDILDLILMQKEHPEYIKEVSVPFNIKVYSIEQLQVLKKESKNLSLPIVHFDATGTVVRKPDPSFKRIYFYSAVIQAPKANRIFPIFSMVSSIHDSNTIFKLFNDFRFFCEHHNFWPAFSKIVTDFSFANLHAMCKSLNRCSLSEYLNKCYELLTDSNKSYLDLIQVHLCCAHFMKMVSNDVDKISTNFEQTFYFKDLIAIAIQTYNLQDFDEYVRNLAIVMNSKFLNDYVASAMDQLSTTNSLKKRSSLQDLISNDLGIPAELEDNLEEGLHKSSPFFKRYFSILINIRENCSDSGPTNIFYNPHMYNHILNKYVPLSPLWTGLLLDEDTRLSNAPAENYFCQVKLNILDSKKNLKCSRFLRLLRKDVLALKVESDLGIPKNRLTKLYAESEQGSQERWEKKRKKVDTHFEGRFLKTFNKPKTDDPCDDLTDHQNNNYYSNNTYDENNFVNECRSFLEKISLSKFQKLRLEEMTRSQGNSQLWKEERRIRVTSSFFGRICKAKNEDSYETIVKSILCPKELNVPAVKYGLLNEDVARKTYSHKFKVNVASAGLFIHSKYPFIAASPDGLVGDSKIIEIKCPYKIRDFDPNSCDLDFLDTTNENINKKHTYYYQIQGALEITDRPQCDLVIFSKKGLKLVEVERSNDFWQGVKDKLIEFYMNHLLPRIIFPNVNLNKQQKKWVTVKSLSFFNNGLVINTNYYKKLKNEREYPVTYLENIEGTIKQITIDDYLSLNDKQQLHSFIIDHCFFLFDKTKEYQIFSVEQSSIIFGDRSDILPSFYNNIKFTKDKVAMPFEKGNHYLLILIHFEKQEFILLDPVGHENVLAGKYFKKIKEVIFRPKNINLRWNLKTESHITQTDGYNCGVYIIYFFHQVVNNLNLMDPIPNLLAYRNNLKYLLLENSSSLKNLCFYCNSIVENACFKCNCCHRVTHFKCILSQKDIDNNIAMKDRTINNICDLCRLN